jgi:hypothetical protein
VSLSDGYIADPNGSAQNFASERGETRGICEVLREQPMDLGNLGDGDSVGAKAIDFVGRFGSEHLLLLLAAQIEKAEPWSPSTQIARQKIPSVKPIRLT